MLIWNQPNLETYTSVVLLHKYCVDTITIAKLIWSYPNQKLNEKVSSVSYFRTEMLSSGLATQPYIGLLRRGIREAQNNIQETDTVVCIQSEYIDKRCPRGKGVRIFFFTSAMQTDQKKKKNYKGSCWLLSTTTLLGVCWHMAVWYASCLTVDRRALQRVIDVA